MLISIDPILNPQLLYTLRIMGHGDQLLLCDANFPAATQSNVIRLDGIDMVTTIKSILSVFPLDSFVPATVHRMEVDGKPEELNEVMQEVVSAIKEVAGDNWKIGSIERQEFYKESKKVYACVVTGERRPYANFILTKGVIKPDGSVWRI